MSTATATLGKGNEATGKADLWGGFSHMTMPPPQYLGAKQKLLPWIMQYADVDGGVAIDGFAGSQCVSYELKKRGCAVRSCDFMRFCSQAGLALIANNEETLPQDEAAALFADNPARGDEMQKFNNVFFNEAECVLLDNFRANAAALAGGKRALAFAVMCRALTRKTIMGHFAHLQALRYAADPARVRRNPSIARPLRALFMELLPQYNAAVFNNGRQSRSVCANILDAMPQLAAGADLAYYDPPYCGSHADYQAFYHLLETFVENWQDKKFINANRRYHPPRFSGFDNKSQIRQSFRRLFELSCEVPRWLISYNDRSSPPIAELEKMAARHKKTRVIEKPYAASRGGRGSVAGSREYLLICKNQLRYSGSSSSKIACNSANRVAL